MTARAGHHWRSRAYVGVPAGWSRGAARGRGSVRDPPRARTGGRAHLVWESAAAPQAPSFERRRFDVVGLPLHRMVDRCSVRGRLPASFALGALPAYVDGPGYQRRAPLPIFIGSIFFTTAAFLQYFEAATTNRDLDGNTVAASGSSSRCNTARIDWWASLVQFIGTLWFNRTTFSALVVGLGASSSHHPVWRPDAFGSICFLVSSWLAWAEVCHRRFAWRPATSRGGSRC